MRMTDNTAENMQEPPKQPKRQIDLLFDDGLFGTDQRLAEDRYYAAQRWFSDWSNSRFNPDFYAVSGLSAADENKLTAADRYLRAHWEIPVRARNIANSVIIHDMSIDDYMRGYPIFNGTNREKTALIRLLWSACDGLVTAYEKIKKL